MNFGNRLKEAVELDKAEALQMAVDSLPVLPPTDFPNQIGMSPSRLFAAITGLVEVERTGYRVNNRSGYAVAFIQKNGCIIGVSGSKNSNKFLRLSDSERVAIEKLRDSLIPMYVERKPIKEEQEFADGFTI